jgi:hypothetical protein
VRTLYALIPLLVLSCANTVVPASDALDSHADRPSVHGMLLVGNQTLYVSHLPMFHAPHDYQAIAEVKLSADDGSDVQGQYVQDRADTGTRVYTLVPQPGVLPQMMRDGATFRAQLYRGHFERGGTVIVDGLTVTVQKVVHFRQFDRHATAPTTATYLAFGRGDDRFLAHYIVAPPDFDQVVGVQLPDGAVDADALAAGVKLTIPAATNDQPVGEGADLSAHFDAGDATVHTGNQLYLEFDDLAQ